MPGANRQWKEQAMITVHHLNDSRSQRILWLLEDIGQPYEIVQHQRDAVTSLAPPGLKAVHPLGKSPVIVDKGVVIAESGTIIDHLAQTYAPHLARTINDPDYVAYSHWLHFAEGSAMLPFLLALYVGRLGDAGAPLQPRIGAEIDNHLSYMNASLANKPYFVGPDITAADYQMSFVAEIAKPQGRLANYPHIAAWLERLQARPGYQAALEKGGPYRFG
jgi:glutathione S-transferase